MSNNNGFYPLTVTGDCDHSMVVRTAEQQQAFEDNHALWCSATEFTEVIDRDLLRQ